MGLLSLFLALFYNITSSGLSLEFKPKETNLGKSSIVQVGVSSGNTYCRLLNSKSENGKRVFVKRDTDTYISFAQCGVNFPEVSLHCVDVVAITLEMK